MPSFNHTRADGFYDPCDLCWTEMSEADKIKSAIGASPDPHEDRCILELIESRGDSLEGVLNELHAEYHGR